MNLQGRCAIVTGGFQGIGKGIALALARQGADIAIYDRGGQKAAEATTAEIQGLGRKCLTFRVDISEYEKMSEIVPQTVEALGRVDILINNAGIISRGLLVADTELQELQRLFAINVFAAFHLTRLVLPYMRRQRQGHIIFLSSDTTLSCPPWYAPYTMSKSALEALTRCLAKEERGYGIRVNAIAPGLVDTSMGRLVAKVVRGMDNIQELYPAAPFGRLAQPSDVGELCAFLVSESGSYISGQVIFVDAGVPASELLTS